MFMKNSINAKMLANFVSRGVCLFNPKFRKFWVESKSNRLFWFGFARIFWQHLWRWSTLDCPTGMTEMTLSIWHNCCSRYCSSVPSAYEHLPKHTVAWVRSVQLKCTVPLGVWNFQNFKQNFVLNGTYHEARCGRHSSGVSWVDKRF